MFKKFFKKFIPVFLLNCYYQFFPFFGALLYRFPSRRLIVVGVTGTNGKSTVVQLISNVLTEAKFKVASASSIRFQINEQVRQNRLKMTMPGRLGLQKFLRDAIKAKCQYAVLEVTSEGIKQFRHKFISFDIAVFTNLTKEHIEAHHGFENYKKAKLELFKKEKEIIIVNLDDKNANDFLQVKAKEKWGYRINPKSVNQESREKNQRLENKNLKIIEAEDIKLNEKSSSFSTNGKRFELQLLGKFNIYNSLAAICLGLSQGIPLETIRQALENTKTVSGRMELVIREPFKVFVDYAHTPDALENVYKTIKVMQGARVLCVLGSCGGGRDRWKRPELGRIANQYCDQIILTNEDPYDENPTKIIQEIGRGLSENKNYKKIIDRRTAIKKALQAARNNDIIIITGKGSEPWMCVKGGKKIAWDDRNVVREEFDKINKTKVKQKTQLSRTN